MNSQSKEPTLQDMEILVGRAERCLTCHATPTPTGSPCYEFTPGGVEVCSELPWWNGKPVMPDTLRQWKEIIASYRAVPHSNSD